MKTLRAVFVFLAALTTVYLAAASVAWEFDPSGWARVQADQRHRWETKDEM